MHSVSYSSLDQLALYANPDAFLSMLQVQYLNHLLPIHFYVYHTPYFDGKVTPEGSYSFSGLEKVK
jgi:hypothetical protein